MLLITLPIFGVLMVAVQAHPQCNDYQAPFKASPGGFCRSLELGGLTCCTNDHQQQLERHLANFTLSSECRQLVEKLICIDCHPYAEHVFTTPNHGRLPGLCPSECRAFQQACGGETVPLSLSVNVTVRDTSDESFCTAFTAEDAGYCYPAAPALNSSQIEISGDRQLCTERVSSLWDRPIALLQPDDGLHRLAVAEQSGVIWMIGLNDMEKRYVYLDMRSQMSPLRFRGDERGLLSIAFHPEYKQNGRFFVMRYEQQGVDRIALLEYASTSDLFYGIAASKRVVLEIGQPLRNHNGGTLIFDTSGMLLFSSGDGGGAGDNAGGSKGNAQDHSNLLGVMVRINVTEQGTNPSYTVPTDNPFVGVEGHRDEIWATGLRNPWRCSLDQTSDKLICGDVGQNKYEEVDVIHRGANYGWRGWEGNDCFDAALCNGINNTRPVFTYAHSTGHRSITGGHIYRGCEYPLLAGKYIFGDYVSGALFIADPNNITADGHWEGGAVVTGDPQICLSDASEAMVGKDIMSFGQDLAGNVYVLARTYSSGSDTTASIYKVVDPRLRSPCPSLPPGPVPLSPLNNTTRPAFTQTTVTPATTTTTTTGNQDGRSSSHNDNDRQDALIAGGVAAGILIVLFGVASLRCFHNPTASTGAKLEVLDHRMHASITPTRTLPKMPEPTLTQI
eukprot:TRINITY_DN9721_c0_g1_i2.p1 TRINITY_DN9721_c0_g1~~TRINITY_DN9721_c0_g1_i2.p1  ORF type:complete len:674 (+),score=122.59 TRINITY_DN9721_c0_g1_i2:61-2082(+)